MASFHHGITPQEVNQGIMPMRNANISTIALIAISTDADDAMYPLDTPVLLTGITQDNLDKAGEDGTLGESLKTIRNIHNPTVVVLRLSDATAAESLNVLRTCESRLGVTPRRFGAGGIDTPDIVHKMITIAKENLGMVYASPRTPDGNLITEKSEIVAYRDTFGDRELCLIENAWGAPAVITSQSSISADGPVAQWSNPITFDMVNHPNQAGFVSVSMDRTESPNYAIDLNAVSTIEQFFEQVVSLFAPMIEYRTVSDSAVEIRFKSNSFIPSNLDGYVPITTTYEKRGAFYINDSSAVGTAAETSIVLADAFSEDVKIVEYLLPDVGPSTDGLPDAGPSTDGLPDGEPSTDGLPGPEPLP